MIKIHEPLDFTNMRKLRAGDEVLYSGVLYSMRDQAHILFLKEKQPPLDLRGQMIYYMGPTPTRPGNKCGSCGPTTGARMDKFTPHIITKTGIIGIIGKGPRSAQVSAAMRGKIVYFIAFSGLGALSASYVEECTPVCYCRLGAEAVFKLKVKDMPLVVAQDLKGGNIYGG